MDGLFSFLPASIRRIVFTLSPTRCEAAELGHRQRRRRSTAGAQTAQRTDGGREQLRHNSSERKLRLRRAARRRNRRRITRKSKTFQDGTDRFGLRDLGDQFPPPATPLTLQDLERGHPAHQIRPRVPPPHPPALGTLRPRTSARSRPGGRYGPPSLAPDPAE